MWTPAVRGRAVEEKLVAMRTSLPAGYRSRLLSDQGDPDAPEREQYMRYRCEHLAQRATRTEGPAAGSIHSFPATGTRSGASLSYQWSESCGRNKPVEIKELAAALRAETDLVVVTGRTFDPVAAKIAAELDELPSFQPTLNTRADRWNRAELNRLWKAWNSLRNTVFQASPSLAHQAITSWQQAISPQEGKLVVVTQNIDGLHCRAASRNVIEVNGGVFRNRCLRCGAVSGDHAPHQTAPPCPHCGGAVRPDARLPGEPLSEGAAQAVAKVLTNATSCIVAGVPDVSSELYREIQTLLSRNGLVVLIGERPSGFNNQSPVVSVDGPVGHVLPELVSLMLD